MPTDEKSRPSTQGSPPARVGDEWIMTAFNDLNRKVGQLESTTDSIKTTMDDIKTEQISIRDSVDGLKKTIWRASGGVAAAVIIAGLLLTVAGWFYKGGIETLAEAFGKSIESTVIQAVGDQPQPDDGGQSQ